MGNEKKEWVGRMHIRGLATFYADRDGQPNDYNRAADFSSSEDAQKFIDENIDDKYKYQPSYVIEPETRFDAEGF